MPSLPLRVDPPFCDCGDCFAGGSVPLSGADWQTVRALFDGTVENASGTELITIVEDGRPDPRVLAYPAEPGGRHSRYPDPSCGGGRDRSGGLRAVRGTRQRAVAAHARGVPAAPGFHGALPLPGSGARLALLCERARLPRGGLPLAHRARERAVRRLRGRGPIPVPTAITFAGWI